MAVNPATSPALSLGVMSITVSWTNSTTSGALHTVYRSRGKCGTYVPVASGILTPYIDSNVSTGEVYAYYIIASVGTTSSTATTPISLQFVGSQDQYKDTLTSQEARTEQKGGVVVYSGTVAAGCGEYQRLQQLRGKSFLCGK